jgi:hypothetical protein
MNRWTITWWPIHATNAEQYKQVFENCTNLTRTDGEYKFVNEKGESARLNGGSVVCVLRDSTE